MLGKRENRRPDLRSAPTFATLQVRLLLCYTNIMLALCIHFYI